MQNRLGGFSLRYREAQPTLPGPPTAHLYTAQHPCPHPGLCCPSLSPPRALPRLGRQAHPPPGTAPGPNRLLPFLRLGRSPPQPPPAPPPGSRGRNHAGAPSTCVPIARHQGQAGGAQPSSNPLSDCSRPGHFFFQTSLASGLLPGAGEGRRISLCPTVHCTGHLRALKISKLHPCP